MEKKRDTPMIRLIRRQFNNDLCLSYGDLFTIINLFQTTYLKHNNLFYCNLFEQFLKKPEAGLQKVYIGRF